jgi:hypothetical protein
MRDRKRILSWVHYRDNRYRIRHWYPDIGISDIVPDIVPDIGVTIPNIGTRIILPDIIPGIGVTIHNMDPILYPRLYLTSGLTYPDIGIPYGVPDIVPDIGDGMPNIGLSIPDIEALLYWDQYRPWSTCAPISGSYQYRGA